MAQDRRRKSDRFLAALEPFERVTILAHTNPDPDAMASGWALCYLIENTLKKPVRLVANGVIERAENKRMANLLKVPIHLEQTLEFEAGKDAVVLIDCGPQGTNHLLASTKITPVAVIDHHEYKIDKRKKIPFVDLRPSCAAAASIAGSYLKDMKLDPPPRLATAMIYAFRTEIFGTPRRFSPRDQTTSRWISNFADFSLISQIENAPVERAYYGDLILAMQNSFIYDNAILSLSPGVQSPEMIGEIADILIRCKGILFVLCASEYKGDLLLSIRAHQDGVSAATLAVNVLNGIGQGGGHIHRAGGRAPDIGRQKLDHDDWESELRARWLTTLGLDTAMRGQRLLAKREIVKNL